MAGRDSELPPPSQVHPLSAAAHRIGVLAAADGLQCVCGGNGRLSRTTVERWSYRNTKDWLAHLE
jgi:hypothetical protein